MNYNIILFHINIMMNDEIFNAYSIFFISKTIIKESLETIIKQLFYIIEYL